MGLIGVTLPGGQFIELVPWNSELWWEVAPWGKWWVRGRRKGGKGGEEAPSRAGL